MVLAVVLVNTVVASGVRWYWLGIGVPIPGSNVGGNFGMHRGFRAVVRVWVRALALHRARDEIRKKLFLDFTEVANLPIPDSGKC
jgi:hypothetical protein